ncbi:tyrosine-protein phosphatase [Levilactobacillus tujiorum]|uniref:tyrosine-protein phosphatase n=1 Tax=Levilactobacillus tujiorum TaxID=2912243 RepID=UPI001456D726|nr:tyrosine-protein phosphatase [Levilactobacillus tujiorum]NLR32856.1 tyrosine-protein phosphatase [Levilactobacillus tujiorum]
MHRSTIVKSLSLAGVVLSLMSVGVPSASAAVDAQAPQTTETATTGKRTSNSKTGQATAAPAIQSRMTADELAEQIATYGDVKDTLIKMYGTKNTRDIGGYKTADGKWQIRKNRLLRSDNLNKINNNDKNILTAGHHVTSIVDFRTDGQISGLPDQGLAGVDNTSISILGEKAYTDSSALSPEFSGDGGFYVQQLEFSQSAVQGYSRFLNMLLQNNFATLYHCSSGKDRTGIATVLIMSILGMDDKTIMNDFMQSYQTGRTVKATWLNEYFREIKSRYVTMNRYITNVLGFSRPQQEKLRSMYLVSTDGKNTPYTDKINVTAPTPSTPKPTPSTPVPAPAPSQPATPVATVTPIESGAADKPHKAKKAKGKIISSKKLHTKYVYHLKSHKKWFKDAHLQKSLGHTTKKHKKTTWKLTNVERIKIKGKTYTYYKIKDHAGHKAWILKAYVVKIKAHMTNHH